MTNTDILVKPSVLSGWWYAYDKVSKQSNLGKTEEAARSGLLITLGFERAKQRRVRRGERARRANANK